MESGPEILPCKLGRRSPGLGPRSHGAPAGAGEARGYLRPQEPWYVAPMTTCVHQILGFWRARAGETLGPRALQQVEGSCRLTVLRFQISEVAQ